MKSRLACPLLSFRFDAEKCEMSTAFWHIELLDFQLRQRDVKEEIELSRRLHIKIYDFTRFELINMMWSVNLSTLVVPVFDRHYKSPLPGDPLPIGNAIICSQLRSDREPLA